MAFTLHQLLTQTAARQPEHEAVRLLNEALTYGELDRLSNQIAHSLIAHGVVRGDRVGIYLQKSPSAIAAIFGIMKTGACYVPVDANAPGLRLEEIGRQCGFRALVTSQRALSEAGRFISPGMPNERHPLCRQSAGSEIAFADFHTSLKSRRSSPGKIRPFRSSIMTSPIFFSRPVPLVCRKA